MVEVALIFSSHFVHQLLSFIYGSFGMRGRLAARFLELTTTVFGLIDITQEVIHFWSIYLRLLHSLLDLLLHVGYFLFKLLLDLQG